ncbi:glucose-6-phosphate isomerase [Maricurvus nonylphenolicus]|uniref:glucose-6-phosphate isomerase n=1 Tax=Maricurvus nonylphenolicus TaxID=1008307 RepID=UPI0036F3B1D7
MAPDNNNNPSPSAVALQQHAEQWNRTLSELFTQDSQRSQTYSLEAASLYLDYSKNHLTQDTIDKLLQLAHDRQLPTAIEALLNGEKVNNTEQRPALHSALRFQGQPKTPEEEAVAESLARMEEIVDQLHRGKWTGYNGDAITDIVNIGIGGSDLGPRMMCDALAAYHQAELKVHFVANIDAADMGDIFKQLNPATTLFIVASKSFGTLETLENAKAARTWLIENGCRMEMLQQHFIAISANVEKAVAFGMSSKNILPMWDWVGGRYSLWSAIGLPIALAIGMQQFNALRAGAHAMDDHFATAPLDQNMPVLLALIQYWYSQHWGAQTQAVLPYSHHMHYFPQFLQQLDMESLGKRVDKSGQPLPHKSGSIVWGAEGSNGQHSFHQLLHQGNHLVPVDFIATLRSGYSNPHQHQHLFACCISQSQALLQGKSHTQAVDELLAKGASQEEAERLAEHQVIPGNRPSNTLILEELTPFSMGALTALYEHKVYSLSVLLGINAFDQWGVELGKQLGGEIFKALESGDVPDSWDSSTQALAQRFLNQET